jgi:hypothetical protein
MHKFLVGWCVEKRQEAGVSVETIFAKAPNRSLADFVVG